MKSAALCTVAILLLAGCSSSPEDDTRSVSPDSTPTDVADLASSVVSRHGVNTIEPSNTACHRPSDNLWRCAGLVNSDVSKTVTMTIERFDESYGGGNALLVVTEVKVVDSSK